MQLALDTSGAIAVAVVDPDGAVRAGSTDTRTRHHAEVLMPMIDAAVRDAGITRADLTGVTVGTGPGPFTGLRVGLVTARVIADTLGVPVRGLCSLYAEALPLLEARAGRTTGGDGARDGETTSSAEVAVVTDARRREVYAARFTLRGATPVLLDGPFVARPDAAAERLGAADAVVGTGTALYPDAFPDAGTDLLRAENLVRAADLLEAAGEDLSSTDPLYLREPDAKVATARKSALGLKPA